MTIFSQKPLEVPASLTLSRTSNTLVREKYASKKKIITDDGLLKVTEELLRKMNKKQTA